MPTRSTTCNSPSQLNSANRPSSLLNGTFGRSVSGQTSKQAALGRQRCTASSSVAGGNVRYLDNPSSPVNLPTTQSELPEEPSISQSLPRPVVPSLQSTPRKANTLAPPRSQEATPEEVRKTRSATRLDGLAASARKSVSGPSVIISQAKTSTSTTTGGQSCKSAASSTTVSGNVGFFNASSLPANHSELPENREPTSSQTLPGPFLKPAPRKSDRLACLPRPQDTIEEVRGKGSPARPDRPAPSGMRSVSDSSVIISRAKTSKSAVTGTPSRKSASLSSTVSGNVGLSNNSSSPINLLTTQSKLPEEWEPTSFQSGPASPSTPRSSPRGKNKLVGGPPRSQEDTLEELVKKGSSGSASPSTPRRSPRAKNKLVADPPRSQEDTLEELVKKGSLALLDGPAACPSKQPPSVLLPQELSSSSPCVPLLTELRKPSTSITSVNPAIADSATIPVADCGSGLFQSSAPYFFTWSPPSKVNEKEIGNGTSRGPGFWDRHLHEKFVLKKIVSAPKLTTLLGEVADTALKQAQANHYKLDLLSGITERNLGTVSIDHTKCEAEVRDFYKESIAACCLVTAGTLGFGTVGKFFTWETVRPGQTQAKADGFLVVATDGANFSALPDEFKQHIKLLEDWKLDILAVWEFKSLAVGSKDVMEAIQQLSSEKSFVWTGCTTRDPCNSTYHPSESPIPPNTGRRTSPDAKSPHGMFSQLEVNTRSHGFASGVDEDHLPDDEDETNDESISYDEDVLPELPEAAKGPVKANHIIQQVWAEAVQCDTTFMVINAGLYELIGFRHRTTQTLYLSDLIKVSKSTPAYGKLHTGLYLATFYDALDRAWQLDHKKTSGTRQNYLYRYKYPHDRVKYVHEDQNDIDSQKREDLIIAQQGMKILTALCESMKSCLKMEVQATMPIFGVDKVQCFYRVNHEGKPLDSDSELPNNLRLLLEPLAGSVYTCRVLFDKGDIGNRFVMKLAQRREDHESLLREYKTYLALKKGGFKGIVEVYGLFRCDAPGMRRTGLVMSHGGSSLLHKTEWKAQVRRAAVCEQFEAIVKALKLTRIDHQGLLLEHFVLNKSKGPSGPEAVSLSLISWKSAKQLTREAWLALEAENENVIESIRSSLKCST